MRKQLLATCLLVFSVVIVFAQTPILPRDSSIKGPQTFAMIIGISKYKYIRPLTYADKDAVLFSDFLRSPGGGHLKDDNIFQLMNDQATSGNFWSKGFQWLKAKKLQKGDRLFIYLSGHGDAIDEDQFFFLGYDCNPGSDKDNYLIGGAIQLYNLKKKIANETAKGVDVFFIMDACRSNELPGGSAGQNFLNTAVSQKKAGEVMMLATAAGQESLEDASIGNGHGLFTYYLVDGLCGVADASKDARITFSEIKSYVDNFVPTIAKQKFNKQQVPYFCCDENSEKIISFVDPAYLQKWLQSKKAGGGNSFNGEIEGKFDAADTLLIDTYNKFNRAIRDNNLSGGNSSAESFYLQLDRKFPNNPYTLDAKSTLAAEFVNDAQKKVNNYIDCFVPTSSKDIQESSEAGNRLEKAISILREDEPEFALSLRGRMNLLLSMGNYSNINDAFRFAYQAKGIDPNAAYINAWLARLHLANNNGDSARYYADKAVKAAPNWPCALTVLALARNATSNNPAQPNNPPKKPLGRSSFGITLGGGLNHSAPQFQTNNGPIVGASSQSAGIIGGGLIYHVPVSSNVSIRPSATFVWGNTEVLFERRGSTGGPITERFPIKNGSVVGSIPVLIKFKDKKVRPYFMLGPSFSYQIGQINDLLPIKKGLFLGDLGFGIDFRIPKTGMVLSPELKFTAGFTDMVDKSGTPTVYTDALSSLKKQMFSLNIYLRKR